MRPRSNPLGTITRTALLISVIAVTSVVVLLLVVPMTLAPSPSPSRAPTSTPTPPLGTRPFPAPTTTRTVAVPTTIDATGTTDAAAALQAFLATVPDGSVIVFKAGGVYRMDRGLSVQNRHNLVFEGNGATLRMSGTLYLTSIWSDPFILTGLSSDIVIRDFTIQGNNLRTGTSIYDPLLEMQSAVGIYGGSRIEIANTRMGGVGGDGVYVADDSPTLTWTTASGSTTAP